jgi:hypothetical protein
VVRIAISVEAFAAIAATLPLGNVSFENKTDEQGQRLIWFDRAMVDRLRASLGLGNRTLGWIQSAAIKLASKGGDAALDVAKAQVTAELTKLVSQFLGLA